MCERKLEEEGNFSEGKKNRVRERVGRYMEKYGTDDLLVEAPIGEREEYLKRARNFYRSYPDKLHKITEKKINKNPEKKHEILLKRAETVPSKGATPGEGDIRLLAECIRLSETPIPGVWRISLLSNDSDFLWFSSDIEREFGIKIHDI
ncbi:hypothetical protein AKJ56_01885 [candidate division MSBL1 archaeon SCGC-AAA382N08]|uniref:Uncharacterized protein n=1 Tax=candidate division MSBL1 archaeon SCGC-AAA382N08 TaxID=1698285 RepID=A0A133VNQ9_9EURY|nr:hypothetical protein AKJ56_01885 [candidate division MSBL1 archaeon SCGC-AAA382N08]